MSSFLHRLFGRLICAATISTMAILTACGGGDNDSPASQIVAPTPTSSAVISIGLAPASLNPGQSAVLTWDTSNVASCSTFGAWHGEVPLMGSKTVTQLSAGTFDYWLTCDGESRKASLTVSTDGDAPVVSIVMSPSNIKAGEKATLAWSSKGTTTCAASGEWDGVKGLSGETEVTRVTGGNFAYTLTCTGPGGTSTAVAALDVTGQIVNVVPIHFEKGPGSNARTLNAPYVSVTLCTPGTNTCQTIDHILLDTGSYGLRIISPDVVSAALNLPAVTNAAGIPVGECAKFVSGYTWGSVRRADVKMGGESALAIPIELISDADSVYSKVPSSCSSAGSDLGTVAKLGANGILGVGLFNKDCGRACETTLIPGVYYGCTETGCSTTLLAEKNQVGNPVSSFEIDNNGVVVVLPVIPSGGVTSGTGSLYFGVGTKSNNAIVNEVVYKANKKGNFTTTYKGINYTSSFLDTGSNGLFFPDPTIPSCWFSPNFFCPSSPLSLTATNSDSDGTASGIVNFTLVGLDKLSFGTVTAAIGGDISSIPGINGFDWGLPFFFGRTVFVVMEGGSTNRGSGPFWAY